MSQAQCLQACNSHGSEEASLLQHTTTQTPRYLGQRRSHDAQVLMRTAGGRQAERWEIAGNKVVVSAAEPSQRSRFSRKNPAFRQPSTSIDHPGEGGSATHPAGRWSQPRIGAHTIRECKQSLRKSASSTVAQGTTSVRSHVVVMHPQRGFSDPASCAPQPLGHRKQQCY